MNTQVIQGIGSTIVLKVQGDVDLYSAAVLFETIVKIMCSASKLILDFSEVEYLDSSGVGAIIKALQLGKEKRIPIYFYGIHGSPRKVLSMVNVLAIINECNSLITHNSIGM